MSLMNDLQMVIRSRGMLTSRYASARTPNERTKTNTKDAYYGAIMVF
jgi:hypothetical protein